MSFSRTLATSVDCQGAAGVKHSQWHEWQVDGLMVRPVAIGRKCKRYPVQEVQAVIDARIGGASDDQIKQLVVKLHAERVNLLDQVRRAA